MRPVYFSAILSPCYGLSSCNYILIPRAVQLSPSNPVPVPPPVRPSLVTVFSQTFPLFPTVLVLAAFSILLSAIIFLSFFLSPSLSFVGHRRYSRSLLRMLIHPLLFNSLGYHRPAGSWCTHTTPSTRCLNVTLLFSFPRPADTAILFPPAGTRPICFALQIELQFSVNRKLPPRFPFTGTRFAFPLFHRSLHWLPLRHPYLITC